MTKTRVLALLSVIALLAALPLSVALAQQPPGIPSLIQGMAMLDGAAPPEGTMVVATVETATEGEDGEMMMEMMEHWHGRCHGRRFLHPHRPRLAAARWSCSHCP